MKFYFITIVQSENDWSWVENSGLEYFKFQADRREYFLTCSMCLYCLIKARERHQRNRNYRLISYGYVCKTPEQNTIKPNPTALLKALYILIRLDLSLECKDTEKSIWQNLTPFHNIYVTLPTMLRIISHQLFFHIFTIILGTNLDN